jgi:hypothetical protein
MTKLRTTHIFADGADLEGILALCAEERIAGFTTNPTRMRYTHGHLFDFYRALPFDFEFAGACASECA